MHNILILSINYNSNVSCVILYRKRIYSNVKLIKEHPINHFQRDRDYRTCLVVRKKYRF